MPRLTITAFADFAQVSRTAVYRAIETGRLKRRKDGSLDTAQVSNAEFVRSHKQEKPTEPQQRKKKRARQKIPGTGEQKKQRRRCRKARPPQDVPYASPFEDVEEPVGGSGEDLHSIDKRYDAELRKTLSQIRKIDIASDEARRILVDRNLVRGVLGTLSQIDVNELLTMGANIAAEIAGICGTEDNKKIVKITKRIEGICYQILQHRQRVIKDFLRKVKIEVLATEDVEDNKKKKGQGDD